MGAVSEAVAEIFQGAVIEDAAIGGMMGAVIRAVAVIFLEAVIEGAAIGGMMDVAVGAGVDNLMGAVIRAAPVISRTSRSRTPRRWCDGRRSGYIKTV